MTVFAQIASWIHDKKVAIEKAFRRLFTVSIVDSRPKLLYSNQISSPKGVMSKSQLAAHVGRSNGTIQNRLKKLNQLNLIKANGNGHDPKRT